MRMSSLGDKQKFRLVLLCVVIHYSCLLLTQFLLALEYVSDFGFLHNSVLLEVWIAWSPGSNNRTALVAHAEDIPVY